MPLREYAAIDPGHACRHCREVFERLESAAQEPLIACPRCGAPLRREYSAPQVGASASSLDDRAQSAGFTKYKKLGHGEYEKQY